MSLQRYWCVCLLLLIVPFSFIARSLPDEPINNGNRRDEKVFDIDEQDKDSFEEYMAFEGRTIEKINIQLLDISGPSVKENSDEDTSWIGSIGNSLHFKTREWVVQNTLLFHEGDTVDALKLSESERLLRASGFFLDARIRIINYQANERSVTVEVITQDKWTLTLLFSYNALKSSSYFGLRDYNLLGLGHTVDASLTHEDNPSIGWGGSIKYNAINVGGTFLNIGTNLQHNRSFNIQNINLSRPYVSTLLDWTGGLDLTLEHGHLEYIGTENASIKIPYRLNYQDVWLGNAYPFWFGTNVFREKTKILASARISRINYTERPSNNRLFENYILFLVSTGIINQRYYKDIYVGGYGITEDIPIGGYISVTGGTEERENTTRWYAGVEGVFSSRISEIGYLSAKFGIGSFRNINKWEQGTINLNLLYHSPLFEEKGWKLRLLLNNDYMYGFNRFEGEQIYLDSESGLRGLNRFSLFGTKRIVLNSEALIFSPYSPLGFVIGGVVFADVGLIAGSNSKIINSKFHQGYGFGLRINNESISRAGFQVSLVYNPSEPGTNKSDLKIVFTGNLVLGSRIFGFFRPSIINYNGVR